MNETTMLNQAMIKPTFEELQQQLTRLRREVNHLRNTLDISVDDNNKLRAQLEIAKTVLSIYANREQHIKVYDTYYDYFATEALDKMEKVK